MVTKTPPKPKAVQAPPASVVRTFLTADVRGYTRFTQENGDEAAARLAIRFAAVTREVVSSYGGEVIELRGDEALSVFASARQALRSSVQLQKRYATETTNDPELPLRVGIGLDAGEVVPVESGFRGGALNMASRLCNLAGPGEVLASNLAVQLARRTKGLAYVERGLVELKGFSEPVPVIRVLDEADQPAKEADEKRPVVEAAEPVPAHKETDEALPIGGFLGALPEGLLVARDEEFDKILYAIQAVEGGSGRLVLLSGEPGVGKTRLAQEVTLKARNHSFVLASGRCYEPESNVPFFPFIEALATIRDLAPASVVSDIQTHWPDVLRILPDPTSLMNGKTSDGETEQQRLFWAVTGFLQAISVERPVAVLLDDLHWADASSLELLQHLARHTRAHRILLLGAYRDVEVGRTHPLESVLRDLGRERLIDEVEVKRFTEAGTRHLIAAVLGGSDMAPGFVQAVHRQTDGNPFFVEEVVRTLVQRGDVHQKHGRWEGPTMEDLEIPKSIRSVIGQRLSCLPETSQDILGEASVLGPAFLFEDLARMSEHSEVEIESAIETARGAGLLRETGGDSYAFNHALTQGTLYAELSARKRRRLHLAAGRSLEQLPESQRNLRVAELAWHFLEADDPEPATRYALEAARAARDVFAHEEAQRHFQVALDLAREQDERELEIKATEGLAGVLRTLGHYDEALAMYVAVTGLHRKAGNVAGERWAVSQHARVHAARGTPKQGIQLVKEALGLVSGVTANESADGDSSTGLASLYATLAHLYQETQQSTLQLEAAERALQFARSAEGSEIGTRLQAEGLMWQASALTQLGELEDARRMLEDVVPLAESAGDLLVLSRALNTAAAIYSEAGNYEKERAYIERALEVAQAMGDPAREAFMELRLGQFHFVRGELDIAEKHIRKGFDIGCSMGWLPSTPWAALELSFLLTLTGRDAEAESLIAEIDRRDVRPDKHSYVAIARHWMTLDRLMRDGEHQSAAAYVAALDPEVVSSSMFGTFLLTMRAWTELERGSVDGAADMADEATERATAENNRTILVVALRIQGLALAREERFDDAERAFKESIATARAIGQPHPEGRSHEDYGRCLITQGRLDDGNSELQEALKTYERLGAVHDIDRLKTLLAEPTADGPRPGRRTAGPHRKTTPAAERSGTRTKSRPRKPA